MAEEEDEHGFSAPIAPAVGEESGGVGLKAVGDGAVREEQAREGDLADAIQDSGFGFQVVEHACGDEHGLVVDGAVDGAVFGAGVDAVAAIDVAGEVGEESEGRIEGGDLGVNFAKDSAGVFRGDDGEFRGGGSGGGEGEEAGGGDGIEGAGFGVGAVADEAKAAFLAASDFGVGSEEGVVGKVGVGEAKAEGEAIERDVGAGFGGPVEEFGLLELIGVEGEGGGGEGGVFESDDLRPDRGALGVLDLEFEVACAGGDDLECVDFGLVRGFDPRGRGGGEVEGSAGLPGEACEAMPHAGPGIGLLAEIGADDVFTPTDVVGGGAMEAEVGADVGVVDEGVDPACAFDVDGGFARGIVAEVLLDGLPDEVVWRGFLGVHDGPCGQRSGGKGQGAEATCD